MTRAVANRRARSEGQVLKQPCVAPFSGRHLLPTRAPLRCPAQPGSGEQAARRALTQAPGARPTSNAGLQGQRARAALRGGRGAVQHPRRLLPPCQRHCGSAGASRGWRGGASELRTREGPGGRTHRPANPPQAAPAGQAGRSAGRPGGAAPSMGAPRAPGHGPAAAGRPGRGGSSGRGSTLAAAAEPPRGP